MKQKEAIKRFMDGQPVLMVEYRGYKAETITWRDKDTKQSVSAPILRHNVEGVSENGSAVPYGVSKRVEDNFVVSSYVSPFKRGEKVVLVFTAMMTERGNITFSGDLHKLEAD